MSHTLTSLPKTEVSAFVPLPDEALRRICAFYNAQMKAFDCKSESTLWNTVFDMFHKPLHKALVDGNLEAVSESMRNLFEGNNCFGFGIANVLAQYESRWNEALIEVAMCCGVLPRESRELPNPVHTDPEGLLAAVEVVVGQIDYPRVAGLKGAVIGGRLIPYPVLIAASVAGTARRLSGQSSDVLEIGAGSGFCAYLMNPFVNRYHIVDLPLMGGIQAHLLMQSVDPKEVWLSGEHFNGERACIHGLTIDESVFGGELDLVINQDSFPEMTKEAAHRNLRASEVFLKTNGFLLSINQEGMRDGQDRVFCLAQAHPSLKLLFRAPWWMRNGYVMEVFTKN